MPAFPAMTPLSLRRLTPGETALCADLFGARLDPGRVRLFATPLWPRPFAPSGGLIVWPAAAAPLDFAAPEVPLRTKAVFVHELTHVWQAQNGVNLLFAKLRAGDSDAAYAYDLAEGPSFYELNIEQQAMVIQHAFLARAGAPTPYSAEIYQAALPDFERA